MTALRASLLTFCLAASMADARPLTKEERACVFKNPVAIGASLTSELMLAVPGFQTVLQVRALARGIGMLPSFGPSPTRILLQSYAGRSALSSYPDYSVKLSQNPATDSGSAQTGELLYGDHKNEYRQASVIFALDLFYWDMIWGMCGERSEFPPEQWAKRLIERTHADGKTLILGNVPYEDPSKVLINSENLHIDGLWYPLERECVTKLNSVINTMCTPSNGCYLVDLANLSDRLNAGEKLRIKADWLSHGLYGMRPDGIHLSTHGSAYVYEQIVNSLEKNPPVCK